ncbi:MAG TPA: TonB-dependent receptor [Polyangia bacterium]|nr:TonB-dependent receptor [Polyangia bacterium]
MLFPDRRERVVDTHTKALQINLDHRRYGTFAEIGAGQEVVRWFFRVGGAAGTVAKSMSAYDMTVSDAIYGKVDRYVCRPRLQAMLDHEHALNLERLGESRGADTAFFAFADTVSARNYKGTNECHGWMGVRFQSRPRDQDSQIVLHVRMLDNENALQQEALGIVGVNLLYGAFTLYHEPELLIESLLDGLTTNRIAIDMIEFSGIEFRQVDNRLMSMKLVQMGLSGAAMFDPTGRVLQPSEVLYKKNVVVERGSFRPVVHVNIDMINSARAAFEKDLTAGPAGEPAGEVVELMELTMRNLREEGGDIDRADFLARADMLAASGKTVLISDYFEYYRLAAYLAQYTKKKIAITMGAASLRDLFDEKYYAELEGGILESFGRLFKNDLRLYIYPLLDKASGQITTVDNLEVAPALRKLYGYLVDRGHIRQLENVNKDYLHIFSRDALRLIRGGDHAWEQMVPREVAEVIKARRFLGYKAPDVSRN